MLKQLANFCLIISPSMYQELDEIYYIFLLYALYILHVGVHLYKENKSIH